MFYEIWVLNIEGMEIMITITAIIRIQLIQ